jgi:hypothetical protein
VLVRLDASDYANVTDFEYHLVFRYPKAQEILEQLKGRSVLISYIRLRQFLALTSPIFHPCYLCYLVLVLLAFPLGRSELHEVSFTLRTGVNVDPIIR